MVSTVPNPQPAGDLGHAGVAALEQAARRLDPAGPHERGRRGPDLGAEGAGERSGAHRGPPGQGRHGEVAVEVIGDVGQHLAQRLALGPPHRELGAELGLAACALGEQHEAAGDVEGEGAAVVVLDEGERQVHAGGDPRRRPHVAVAHEDPILVDADRRVQAGHEVAHRPVRRGPAPVEQAGGGQDQRPAAHRGDAPAAVGGGAQPGQQGRVRHRLRGCPSPPATTRVSMGPSCCATAASATSRRPDVARIWRPADDSTVRSYSGVAPRSDAAANTSAGPLTSRDWTSG